MAGSLAQVLAPGTRSRRLGTALGSAWVQPTYRARDMISRPCVELPRGSTSQSPDGKRQAASGPIRRIDKKLTGVMCHEEDRAVRAAGMSKTFWFVVSCNRASPEEEQVGD